MVMVPPRRVRWTGARFERVVLPPAEPVAVWDFCVTCSGQGREYAYGEFGWIWRNCTTCCGVGSVMGVR